ncbi:MAG: arginase family protein [Thermomicrobiales bacterium]
MTSFELSLGIAERTGNLNRQGVPCFLGSQPAASIADLAGADVAIVGVPFVSPLIGFENDLAPRKVRIAGLTYWSSYVPELEIDPAAILKMADYGDVDFPFGDTRGANAAVEATIREVVAAGALPVTIGGNAPASSFAVINGITAERPGTVGVISFDGHCDTAPDWGVEPNSSNWVLAAYEANAQLSRANHVQIGLRGMNNRPVDMAYFRDNGMRTIMAREARAMGSQTLAEAAVEHATAGVDHLWLAVDLDVLDSSNTPDWDWPDPYGLIAGDILETAYLAGKSGKLCGVSLMMIGGNVASVQRIAVWIILYALAGYAAAKQG